MNIITYLNMCAQILLFQKEPMVTTFSSAPRSRVLGVNFFVFTWRREGQLLRVRECYQKTRGIFSTHTCIPPTDSISVPKETWL